MTLANELELQHIKDILKECHVNIENILFVSEDTQTCNIVYVYINKEKNKKYRIGIDISKIVEKIDEK